MSEWSIRGSPAADLCLSARRRWVFFAQVRKSRASATLIPSPTATKFAGRCCSLARSSTARIFRPEKSATLDRAAQALKGTKKGSSFAFLNGNRAAVFEDARARPRKRRTVDRMRGVYGQGWTFIGRLERADPWVLFRTRRNVRRSRSAAPLLNCRSAALLPTRTVQNKLPRAALVAYGCRAGL